MKFSSKLLIVGFIVFLTMFVGIKAVNMFNTIADNSQNRIDKAFNICRQCPKTQTM